MLVLLQGLFGQMVIIPSLLSLACAIAYILIWNKILDKSLMSMKRKILLLVFICLDPNLLKHTYTGIETTAVYFITVLIIYRFFVVQQPSSLISGLIIGVAVLIRPEFLLFGILLFLFDSRSLLSPKIVHVVSGIGVIIIPWIGFSYYYFGNALPLTFFAKGADYPIGRNFLVNILSSLSILGSSYLVLFLLLGYIYVRSASSEVRKLLYFALIMLCSFILFYSVTISNEFVFSRYYVMCIPPLFYVLVLSVQNDQGSTFIYKSLLFILPLTFLLASLLHSQVYASIYHESETTEDKIIFWIQKNTKKNERIYRDRIGKIAYATDRYIVDPVGLINREISDYRRKGELCNFILKKRTDILISSKKEEISYFETIFKSRINLLYSIPTRDNFLVRQTLMNTLKKADSTQVYTNIYRITRE